MREDINIPSSEINIYCFSGNAKLIIKIYGEDKISVYDEEFNSIDNPFLSNDEVINTKADEIIKQAVKLSKQLAKDFIFVRVDWLIFENKLFFQELTFTPYSGFKKFKSAKDNLKFGKLINLKGNIND